MGDVKESGNSEIEHISMQVNGYPRDLLKRFTAVNHRPTEFAVTGEDTEEIELNLGLSLGGCFGVEPKGKKLVRSSSIAGFMTSMRDDDTVAPPPVSFSALMRTCSLPTETEEERMNRKELQSLRRMEAKRKRSEKQRNFREAKDRASLERNCEEDKRVEEGEGRLVMSSKQNIEGNIGTGYPSFFDSLAGKHQRYLIPNGFSPSLAPSFGLPPWAAAAAQGGVIARGVDAAATGKTNGLTAAAAAAAVSGGGLQGFPQPSSQGSIGSQGSTSSGFSEFESRPGQASNNCTEARSPASVQSLPEHNEQKSIITSGTSSADKSGKFAAVETDNSSKKPKVIDDGTKEMGRNVMEEMPCVSTKGNGPNGRRIEGFLYRYRKGEEVRIVCVCHGSFLSPAEFVKHAGGGDVAHPLRHIVVNPTPSSFL